MEGAKRHFQKHHIDVSLLQHIFPTLPLPPLIFASAFSKRLQEQVKHRKTVVGKRKKRTKKASRDDDCDDDSTLHTFQHTFSVLNKYPKLSNNE